MRSLKQWLRSHRTKKSPRQQQSPARCGEKSLAVPPKHSRDEKSLAISSQDLNEDNILCETLPNHADKELSPTMSLQGSEHEQVSDGEEGSGRAARPHIRLLRIHQESDDDELISCTIRDAMPNDTYVCLSYCWGDAVPDQAIIINNREVLIRPNLFAFLQTARRYKFDILIWIDALCIDQENIEEKHIVVPQMGNIFRDADFVVVWLGLTDEEARFLSGMQDAIAYNGGNSPYKDGNPSTLDEPLPFRHDNKRWSFRFQLTMQVAHLLSQPKDGLKKFTTANIYYEYTKTVKDWLDSLHGHPVLRKVQDADFWRRAWIVQEVSRARYTWVLCPIDIMPISFSILTRIINYHAHAGEISPAGGSIYRQLYSVMRHDRYRNESILLKDLLSLTRHQKCQHIRDRLFSVLSTAWEGQRPFPVRYDNSDSEVMYQGVIYLFEQSAQILDLSLKKQDFPVIWKRTDFHTTVGLMWECFQFQSPVSNAQLPTIDLLLNNDYEALEERTYWLKCISSRGSVHAPYYSEQHQQRYEIAFVIRRWGHTLLMQWPLYNEKGKSFTMERTGLKLWQLEGRRAQLLHQLDEFPPSTRQSDTQATLTERHSLTDDLD